MSITPTGYRIYWATNLNNLYTPHAHPTLSIYNSPITTTSDETNTKSVILSGGATPFWDVSMTQVYISIAAYFDDGEGNITEGAKSKPVLVLSHTKTLGRLGGYSTYSIPLNSGDSSTNTIGTIKAATTNRVSQMFYASAGKIRAATVNTYVLRADQGVLLVPTAANVNITWRGTPWEKLS